MNALTFLTLLATADPVTADLILKGGTIYDGSGSPGVVGDLALKGDRIVAIGKFAVAGQPKVIDCGGLAVAPGFIDLHTHSDEPLQHKATRQNLSYLTQGLTTAITGNCGSGPVDAAKYFAALEKDGIGSNVIHLATHNSIRQQVMGNVNRSPTADELAKMKALVDKAMADGAWGLSTGLIYNPGTYSKTDEIIELAKAASAHRGIYASHMRDEGAGLLDAIRETLQIGKDAKLPVHISHIKASGRRNWGKAADAIALIESARATGQAVTADQYPYPASSTSLKAMVIPAKYREGSAADFQARVADPAEGPKIKKAIEDAVDGRAGGKSLRVAQFRGNPTFNGKDIAEIADMTKRSMVDVVLEIEKAGGAQMVSFGMSEEDVRLFMKRPWVATASDGGSKVPDTTSVPHPRSYGTFPRKIGRYAIADGMIPLEFAIRSASGLPADILKLPERGYLKLGWFADVVVFDPATFRDTATFEKPHQYATGVKWLYVNGTAAIAEGKPTTVLAGRVLRHQNKD
ncbi:MAG: D-aminoacylase [Gemmataceae bacterium]